MNDNNEVFSDALVDLQTQLAFQEATIAELNRAISEQQTDILTLKRQMTLLKEELDAVLAPTGEAGGDAPEPPPPHY